MHKSGNKKTIVCLLLLHLMAGMSFISFGQKKFDPSKKFSPEFLRNDASVLGNVIMQMHPVIGIYHSRQFYENELNQFIQSINDSLTEKQFRIKLKLLLESLHCGHTEVWQSKSYVKYIKPLKLNFIPYYIISLNNKLYAGLPVQLKKDTVIRPGTEIIAINDISVDSILHYSSHFVSGDGFVTKGKEIYLRSGINYSYPSLFGRPDTFEISCRIKDSVKKFRIKAANMKELPSFSFYPKSDSTLKKHKRANISTGELIGFKNTRILKIKSFRHIGYKTVYRKFFREAAKDNVQNVIIDLRYNGGGNLMNSYKLLTYLLDKQQTVTLRTHVKKYPLKKYTKGNLSFRFTKWVLGIDGKKTVKGDSVFYTHIIKPDKKRHYGNNVYVLCNGGSFSASCIVAAYLKASGRATFIGTETGGAAEGCNAGVTPYYTLPYTKIRARIPAFRIIHDIQPAITGKGVIPDIEVNYTLADLFGRKDMELEKVKELIK